MLSYFLSVSALISTKLRDEFGVLSVRLVPTVRKAISNSLLIQRNARLLRRSGMTSESSNNYFSLQILNSIVFEFSNLIDFSFLNTLLSYYFLCILSYLNTTALEALLSSLASTLFIEAII